MTSPLGPVEDGQGCRNPVGQVDAFYLAVPELRGDVIYYFWRAFMKKRGCDLLIGTFAQVVAMAPGVDLVMARPDQAGMQAGLQSRAEKLGIARTVHWLGMVSGDVKWGALRQCEDLILPSHQEAGVAQLRCKYLAGDRLRKGGLGRRRHARRHSAVTGALVSVVRGGARREGAQCPPCFAERFSMERAAAAIIEVFSSACG